MLGNGDLYIYSAGPSDGYKSYACRTVHRLTGDVQASAYPGRIIITGKSMCDELWLLVCPYHIDQITDMSDRSFTLLISSSHKPVSIYINYS